MELIIADEEEKEVVKAPFSHPVPPQKETPAPMVLAGIAFVAGAVAWLFSKKR